MCGKKSGMTSDTPPPQLYYNYLNNYCQSLRRHIAWSFCHPAYLLLLLLGYLTSLRNSWAFHPTLMRVWSRKGRRGQRLIEAPGDNRKAYGFGLLDWRDGWFDGRVAPRRDADVFCKQVRAAVARSKQRGRVATV
jgi:hypothetical protein